MSIFFFSSLLSLLTLCTPGHAASGEQKLVYDLISNGTVIGRREVTIRYLPPLDPTGEPSRIIETWTELDALVGGWGVSLRNRATAHATKETSSFTSSISVNDRVSEIQGQLLLDGHWQMYGHYEKGQRRWDLRRTEVDLSSLDLYDPERSKIFSQTGRVQVLSVESGQVMVGPIVDMGTETLVVGDRQIEVHRWAWIPREARFELAWSEDGLLIDWSAEFRGQRLDARIRELPSQQIYGQITTLEEFPPILEEEL